MQKAIFFDRDGVIISLPKNNEAYGFVYKSEDVKIIPDVYKTLRALEERGYLAIVITNQPAVARGLLTESELEKLHSSINQSLSGMIRRFYYCPHHPEMHPDVPEHAKKYRIVCSCRKPSPGMILQAGKDFNIDLAQSWMVGDMITDIISGKNAGCKTVLVNTPASNRPPIVTSQEIPDKVIPDYSIYEISELLNIIK